jgi:hypothetical protein
MPVDKFEILLSKVEEDIQKQNTTLLEASTPKEKLAVWFRQAMDFYYFTIFYRSRTIEKNNTVYYVVYSLGGKCANMYFVGVGETEAVLRTVLGAV